MDSALKTPVRRAWMAWLVFACLGDLGCARLQSFTADDRHPMLGSTVLPEPGSQRPIKGDLYAQRQAKAEEKRAALLAAANQGTDKATQSRSTAHPSGSGSLVTDAESSVPPLAIALEPPVALGNSGSANAEVAASVPRETDTTAPGSLKAQPSTSSPRPRSSLAARTGSERAPKRPKETAAPTNLEAVVSASRAKIESLTSYQVLMTRQERVGQILQDPEEVLLSIRQKPRAVRLEWPNGSNKGREVIYSATENNGLMHVNMGDTAIPVPRLALAPDSPLVLRTSRHPINEAGFDTILASIEQTIALSKKGDKASGKVEYAGLEKPDELDHACHKIVRVTPEGETWIVYIDPETKLPAMFKGNALNGDILERYVFGTVKLNLPELASADAFNPISRWGEPKGLLQRLARAGAAASRTPAGATAR